MLNLLCVGVCIYVMGGGASSWANVSMSLDERECAEAMEYRTFGPDKKRCNIQ